MVLGVFVVQLNKQRIILAVVLLHVKMDLGLVEHIARVHIRKHNWAANPRHHLAMMGSVNQPERSHVGHSVTYFPPSGVLGILAKLANIRWIQFGQIFACLQFLFIKEVICNIQAASKSLIH